MAIQQRITDTEMQHCLVDCYQSQYPLARLKVFLESVRARGVSEQEVHQMERAILKMLASLRAGGHRTTTTDEPVVRRRPK